MDEEKRNRLIDDYYTGIDTADRELLRGAFAADILHEHPVRTMEGLEEFLTFKVDEQPPQDAEHELGRRIHVPAASVVQGRKVGTVAGDPVDIQFCDVFEFSADDSAITTLSVYVRE